MKQAEILSVGEELLSGSVVDTNAVYLSRALADAGYSVTHRQTVGDEESEIRSALALAHSRCDLVVVTGGLGPTHDDLTRPAAAAYFGMPLFQDERIAASLRAYFDRRGVTMSENNLLQAQVPEGATVLRNDWGTAPGLFLEKDGKRAVLLPGVPREMKALFENRVLPLIQMQDRIRERCILRFYGLAESSLDDLVSHLDCPEKGIGAAPYAGGGEVALHLVADGPTRTEAKKRLEALRERVLSLVGEHCYGEGDSSLEKELVCACIREKISLATAESCTGGLLSQRITSVPGASAVFSLGLCTYSEKEKMEKLGVLPSTLKEYGVYSEACALEMARGAAREAGARLGIGITGIAGPDGGTEKDPVGTVYIGVVLDGKEEVVRATLGGGKADREYVRRLASSKALYIALKMIKNSSKTSAL